MRLAFKLAASKTDVLDAQENAVQARNRSLLPFYQPYGAKRHKYSHPNSLAPLAQSRRFNMVPPRAQVQQATDNVRRLDALLPKAPAASSLSAVPPTPAGLARRVSFS